MTANPSKNDTPVTGYRHTQTTLRFVFMKRTPLMLLTPKKMKNVVLMTICIFLVVEGLVSLEKATPANKALLLQPFAPWMLSTDEHRLSGLMKRLRESRSSRQTGQIYQPQLVASNGGDTYFWANDRDYTFGEVEDSGNVQVPPGATIFKTDSFQPTGEPGVYELAIVFFTEEDTLLPPNDFDIGILFLGIGQFKSSIGTVEQLELPFPNGVVLGAAVYAFVGESLIGGVNCSAQLNGTKLVAAGAGLNLGESSGVNKMCLVIHIQNPAENSTGFVTSEISPSIPTSTITSEPSESSTESSFTKPSDQSTQEITTSSEGGRDTIIIILGITVPILGFLTCSLVVYLLVKRRNKTKRSADLQELLVEGRMKPGVKKELHTFGVPKDVSPTGEPNQQERFRSQKEEKRIRQQKEEKERN